MVFTHYDIRIVNNSLYYIKSIIFYLNSFFKDKNILIHSFNLPSKSKSFSILKSSHVYSKFREVYKQKIYKAILVINIFDVKETYVRVLINLLQNLSSYVTSDLKIKYIKKVTFFYE